MNMGCGAERGVQRCIVRGPRSQGRAPSHERGPHSLRSEHRSGGETMRWEMEGVKVREGEEVRWILGRASDRIGKVRSPSGITDLPDWETSGGRSSDERSKVKIQNGYPSHNPVAIRRAVTLKGEWEWE